MKKIADVKQRANTVNVRVKRESQVPSWFESVVEEEETMESKNQVKVRALEWRGSLRQV